MLAGPVVVLRRWTRWHVGPRLLTELAAPALSSSQIPTSRKPPKPPSPTHPPPKWFVPPIPEPLVPSSLPGLPHSYSSKLRGRPRLARPPLTCHQLPLGLLNAAQGHPILVELKNGENLNGHLVMCDTWMNLTLKEVVQSSPVRLPSSMPYATRQPSLWLESRGVIY